MISKINKEDKTCTKTRKRNIDMKSLKEASLAFDALINRAVKK